MNHRNRDQFGRLSWFIGQPKWKSYPPKAQHKRLAVKLFAILFAASCVFGGQVIADNLIPNPSFQHVSELGLKTKGWNWHRIEEPCQVRSHQNKVALEGGKVFLHTDEFQIDAGTIYEFQVEASGTAMFSMDVFWWTKDARPTRAHRSPLVSPVRLSSNAAEFQAKIRAPDDAVTAYIRYSAENGQAVLSSPVMSPAAGELLLKLDAAAPGSNPDVSWEDLTGRNQDFNLKSVHYSAKSSSYVFGEPGAMCIGAQQDASQFDFETDQSAGAGFGSPFSVVFYAKLTGRSGTGIVNKLGDPTGAGWSIGLQWDSFNLDRISTLQQFNNTKNRTINGFPGLAGDGRNRKLGATDKQFHLYVIHLTGSGRRDGAVYYDGSEMPLNLSPWPWGSLSSGSVKNDLPLRIGSFNQDGFRGEIGFIEIWSGSRLKNRMTPAEYSKYRYNDGIPVRAK